MGEEMKRNYAGFKQIEFLCEVSWSFPCEMIFLQELIQLLLFCSGDKALV